MSCHNTLLQLRPDGMIPLIGQSSLLQYWKQALELHNTLLGGKVLEQVIVRLDGGFLKIPIEAAALGGVEENRGITNAKIALWLLVAGMSECVGFPPPPVKMGESLLPQARKR